ncbi:MAG TPA: P1 family peptidase [Beijerinckiaceae bacterium]|jgi:L-aminopeptidase/D-esterase-like protein
MTSLRNHLLDVPGLTIGHAQDLRLASGVTAILFEEPVVASVAVVGGAPAGRDLECLEPDRTVEGVDAIVLSGGSAFGLDAASGVQAYLREQGRGFLVRSVRVPIVPQAICFDLLNGGDKDWGRYPPYRELGYAAASAAGQDLSLGTVGGGTGATTVNLKGGVGAASAVTAARHTVAAIVVVNAIGSAVVDGGPHFWAGPHEIGDEFGGLGPSRSASRPLRWKGAPEPATTIALVATDAMLTKAQAKRLALVAQGGLAKGLSLSHAMTDGDIVFAASTGRRSLSDPLNELIELGALAATCLARAIARGVHEATALPFPGALPAWKDRFADRSG